MVSIALGLMEQLFGLKTLELNSIRSALETYAILKPNDDHIEFKEYRKLSQPKLNTHLNTTLT